MRRGPLKPGNRLGGGSEWPRVTPDSLRPDLYDLIKRFVADILFKKNKKKKKQTPKKRASPQERIRTDSLRVHIRARRLGHKRVADLRHSDMEAPANREESPAKAPYAAKSRPLSGGVEDAEPCPSFGKCAPTQPPRPAGWSGYSPSKGVNVF